MRGHRYPLLSLLQEFLQELRHLQEYLLGSIVFEFEFWSRRDRRIDFQVKTLPVTGWRCCFIWMIKIACLLIKSTFSLGSILTSLFVLQFPVFHEVNNGFNLKSTFVTPVFTSLNWNVTKMAICFISAVTGATKEIPTWFEALVFIQYVLPYSSHRQKFFITAITLVPDLLSMGQFHVCFETT